MEPYFVFLAKILFDNSRVIYAIHDVEPHYGVSIFFKFFLDIKIKIFRNFQVFSSTQEKIFIRNYLTKNKKVFRIPLYLKDFGKSLKIPSEDKVQFLFFGKIVENKGIEYLIDAANKLWKTYPSKFVVKINGNCQSWSSYDQLIIERDAFEINIGPVPNERVADLFCESHYIILPYKDITQSGPLMLAYNYGIPAIASNLPGFLEHIRDKEHGYLFETENANSLYNILCEVIKNHSSNYLTMKESLIAYVRENYSDEKINKEYSKMLLNI